MVFCCRHPYHDILCYITQTSVVIIFAGAHPVEVQKCTCKQSKSGTLSGSLDPPTVLTKKNASVHGGVNRLVETMVYVSTLQLFSRCPCQGLYEVSVLQTRLLFNVSL